MRKNNIFYLSNVKKRVASEQSFNVIVLDGLALRTLLQIKSNFISLTPFVQNVQYKVLNNAMENTTTYNNAMKICYYILLFF